MSTCSLRIGDEVRLRVDYDDATPFGGALSGKIDERIREACRHIIDARKTRPMSRLVADSLPLLATAFQPSALGDLYVGTGQLKEDCLYPPVRLVHPAALVVELNGCHRSLPVGIQEAGDLAHWIGEWSRGSGPPATAEARELWEALREIGALVDCARDADAPGQPGLFFVGHATVAHRVGSNCILIDPFLLPRSDRHPATYQPVTATELGLVDAILITHSHPDHFDPGSLLRFGADVPIYVPAVERESILAIDIALRLEQLGFSQVRRLKWFDEARVGCLRVVALPFYGEQPTCNRCYHPEVRNVGNTYLVGEGGARVAYLADAGSDAAGDIKQVATAARERYGPVDTLFGTHRGFPVYPIQYLFSSVARYLLFVPRESWTTRQKIMNDAHDLLDTAEDWGARQVIPYACGGAPWYWELGLGPRPPSVGRRFQLTDPPPEEVADAHRARSETREGMIPSPVAVCLMRPGEHLDISSTAIRREVPHQWPYGILRRSAPDIDKDPELLLRGGEDLPVVRKKVLLQILAAAEAERRAVSASATDVQTMADTFRIRYGLLTQRDVEQWLAAEGLDISSFVRTMHEFAVVEKLCEVFAAQIDEALSVALRINTARDYLLSKQRTS
jgi:L-ascorbate metabolism protein UlaG (beta-lactamase superfamily)